ncbi:ABC transporter permease [Paenibacillus lemnae]|uniref:ABC transporter permease subunit n=1 Tax=Paenibacillus lemnae TaxID=1330551 RepID=A0A848M796_PAELE|nr:ABC transporter permease [Paenibacillus lemnae]NMO95723.1 ABC transporter permease subunit [Paenibacillus lemnae]
MTDFLKLVANENMKIYSRSRTWVMLAILVLCNAGMPLLFYIAGGDMDRWTVFSWTESFTFMLTTIFTVVIAAEMIAGEFTWGTIKLLLIRPWSRGKILLSKYLAVLLFSIVGTVITALTAFIFSSMLFESPASGMEGFMGGTAPRGALLNLLTDYVELFVIALIAFMISTVFRSGSLAIGLSLFILFVKNLFGLIFNPERFEWAKYVLFLHTDLSVYIHSPTGPGGVSLWFSVTVLAVYCLIFAAITWTVFAKRDVAA